METDEKTRFRMEFVRMKIACRDITRVPRVAEGTLGLNVHDFIFEREVQAKDTVKVLSSGIKVGDNDTQPPSKKFKGDSSKTIKQLGTSAGSLPQNSGATSGKQLANNICMSAPPKYASQRNDTNPKDAKLKAIVSVEDQGEKVHIPDSFDDSDAESDTLSEKIRRLEGYGDLGQGGSKSNNDNGPHQLWHMEIISDIEKMTQIFQEKG